MPATDLPLTGLRVVDLSRILAGPFASMKLADMGAEVIKIEAPGKGDDTRGWGPPFVQGESAYFLSVNRGKKSVTLDLKRPAGREVLTRLIRSGDVVLENFRPGTMERLGFGWEDVRRIQPRAIYAAISGYGHAGARRDDPAYDVIVQGECGVMDLTGPPDGPPTKVGISIADLTAAMLAVEGILLALYQRERTGLGQKVDVAMLDGMLSLLTYQSQNFFATGRSPRRNGNRHPNITPYETFRTRDGYVNVGVANEVFWGKFCSVVGMPELEKDARFEVNARRVEHREALEALLAPKFLERTSAEWHRALREAGIPAGIIRSVGEVCGEPERAERGMVVEIDHPKAGRMKTVGNPVKLSGAGAFDYRPAPLLGQHTAEVLGSLGYSAEEIAALARDGVI